MSNKLTPIDLQVMKDRARQEWLDFPAGSKLPGMTRALAADEVRALCWYQATIAILNKQGGLRPGWLEANPIQTEMGDSDPMTDAHDYNDPDESP